MSAEFFYKRIIRHFSCVIAFVFVVFCAGYAFTLSRIKRVAFSMKVYFLVEQGGSVEAGVEFVKWNGGAGYVIEYGGEIYVAINVFFDVGSAKKVQDRLAENGNASTILSQEIYTLYFEGGEKKTSALYVNALKQLKSYIFLLEDCIAKLENGMSQEACKRILKIIAAQFQQAQRIYADYPRFKVVCKQTEQQLQSIYNGTVYLKDLRFLLCYQADCLMRLCSAFSI